jgi:hypothetical protein
MGERKCANKVLVGRPEGKNNLVDLGVDESLILNYIFKKWVGDTVWIDWLGTGKGCRNLLMR